ncbi:MAG TPA: ribosome small subunit-dependent GTPase A [Candidatus Limivivens merdigallinarum]|uniref:Small ribosomal subunit biogenesis GTPase RsgA n=1 Tax=Candidatus Limivivens merdigallinarum TaxID=2840859 RepID=A0A9D0ZWZ5_9FIRM|nr:ribosome small subunit-dependent GTPase A [Candidatus Limivivens merdigallinarum]
MEHTGKIIKGIAGFYYVHVEQEGVYECRAKGIFRKSGEKPLVGDNVRIEILSRDEMEGNLVEILPRKNVLIRPAVSNVDQALVIFAAAKPKPNFNLLDRFLVMMAWQDVDTVICFNKKDIASQEEETELRRIYSGAKSKVLFTSAREEEGIEEIREILKGKTTTVAGPSGVGKSSLINLLVPEAKMETGEISHKIDRGRHTTRHSELFYVEADTYIMDTPGFSSLILPDMEKEDLKDCFAEFKDYEDGCRFKGCMHLNEPDCAVKKAVEEGQISLRRYTSYQELFEELKNRRKY